MAAQAGKEKGEILDEAIEAIWTPERKQVLLDNITELGEELEQQKTDQSISDAGVVQ